MHNKTHIGARTLLIAGVLSLFVGLLYVRAEEPGITYAHGSNYHYQKFDLKIDSEATYNGNTYEDGSWSLKDLKPNKDKFWDFSDVKPGDHGENTVSLHVTKDAWMCLEFINLEQDENGENEPESLVDTTPGGDLAKHMQFFAWHDDGDNIFEVGEKPILGPISATEGLDNQVYPIADYAHGPALPGDETSYFGIYWCAGELSVDTENATITCDGSTMGNESQTDSMSVDVQLVAAAAKDEKKFKCRDIKIPPPGEQCEVGKVDIKIDNDATVVNNTSSNANTGGNTAGSGGTVTTGDATSNSSSSNTVNTTIITGGSNTTVTNSSSVTTSSSSGGNFDVQSFLRNLFRR